MKFQMGQQVQLPEWFGSRIGWIVHEAKDSIHTSYWVILPLKRDLAHWTYNHWKHFEPIPGPAIWRKQFGLAAFRGSELTAMDGIIP